MAEKMLDGKAIALVVKEDGLAMLTVYNIYSYDLEKFIKEVNKNRLLPKMLAKPSDFLMEFRVFYRSVI